MVLCTLHSPLRIEMAPLPDVVTLAFTEQGGAVLTADGNRVQLAPRCTALFLPSCDVECETGSIVSVLIHDSARQLAATATAAALAGSAADGDPYLRYRLHRPAFLDGSEDPRRPALLASLRQALRLLDPVALLEGKAFAALQLEDLLRRHLAQLLWPALLTPQGSMPAQAGRDPILQDLLEWMDAHHHEPITLTQLARRSGDSLRNLQYRFRGQVGCTPMQWLRRRRLEAAHGYLQRAAAEESVAAIARRQGFHHLSGSPPAFGASTGCCPRSCDVGRAGVDKEAHQRGPTVTTAEPAAQATGGGDPQIFPIAAVKNAQGR